MSGPDNKLSWWPVFIVLGFVIFIFVHEETDPKVKEARMKSAIEYGEKYKVLKEYMEREISTYLPYETAKVYLRKIQEVEPFFDPEKPRLYDSMKFYELRGFWLNGWKAEIEVEKKLKQAGRTRTLPYQQPYIPNSVQGSGLCRYPSDIAIDGSVCGDRAASRR